MYIDHEFARALAVIFQSISVRNYPERCDTLHVRNPASDVPPGCHIYNYENFLSQKIRPCYENFIIQKFSAIRYYNEYL